MKLKILALVVMLGIVGRVDADTYFMNGGKLLSACESDQAGFQGGCTMYLMGVSDTAVVYVGWEALPEAICLTVEVTGEQMRKIFIKHANEHPEDLHLGASGMVIQAFLTAFPCE